MGTIKLKRIYEAPSPEDGTRILVDRIWPRGMSKEAAHLDLWLKEIAPSSPLRDWYHHQEDTAENWKLFTEHYRAELDKNKDAVNQLLMRCNSGPVTLLFGRKNTLHNQAVFLKTYLEERRDNGTSS